MCVRAKSRSRKERRDLGLALPVLDVLDGATAAGIDELAWLDQDVICGDDIDDGGLLGVIAGDPYSDGDVVGRLTICYWQKTMDTEKELCAAIVEG